MNSTTEEGINNERRNIKIILIDATKPNSCNVSLLVSINAAKPDAVVRFVNKVIFPIFCTILLNA